LNNANAPTKKVLELNLEQNIYLALHYRCLNIVINSGFLAVFVVMKNLSGLI